MAWRVRLRLTQRLTQRSRPGCVVACLRSVAWALCCTLPVHAAEAVQVPSLDSPAGTAVVLPAHWFPLSAAGPGAAPGLAHSLAPGPAPGLAPGPALAPALVLLHGCGGLYDRPGRLALRYTELAARLNAMGVHALAPDSLTPRGERELCTQRTGQRRVTPLQRRRDALGALQWLAAQPGVDPLRVGLLGWSNGGSTVLAASNRSHPEVRAAPVQPTLAVAFYPGCESELQRGYTPAAPLLMLLGEADDWTPAAPCKALAAAARAGAGASGAPAAAVQWESYAGAVHGFDGSAAVRVRADVPNGRHPGQGVHVGGDAAARAASALALEQFLRAHWALTTAPSSASATATPP